MTDRTPDEWPFWILGFFFYSHWLTYLHDVRSTDLPDISKDFNKAGTSPINPKNPRIHPPAARLLFYSDQGRPAFSDNKNYPSGSIYWESGNSGILQNSNYLRFFVGNGNLVPNYLFPITWLSRLFEKTGGGLKSNISWDRTRDQNVCRMVPLAPILHIRRHTKKLVLYKPKFTFFKMSFVVFY